MNFLKNLRQKFITGDIRDIVGRYTKSSYRYNYTAPEFFWLCQLTYNRSVDLQEGIDIFSKACSNLPLCFSTRTEKNIDIPDAIQDFLQMPSTEQLNFSEFIKSLFVQFFVSGEIFLLKNRKTNKLTLIRPDEVTDIKIMEGIIFRYKVAKAFFDRVRLSDFDQQADKLFESELKDGVWINEVCHFYHRNPILFGRGLSIVVGLLNDIEILFKGRTWNRSMLDNEGRPSGVFFYPPQTSMGRRPHVPVKGAAKVEAEINQFYAGDLNAGKALFLKGGMQFKEITYKMKDIDFLQGLYFSRESIANRLGIPLQLFGSEKKSTYNNMREARYAFYLNTCIPFFNNFLHFFTLHVLHDLFPQTKPFTLCINKQKIFHASPMFLDQILKLKAEHFLTGNEKRALLGFNEINDGNMDTPLVPTNLIPVEDLGLVEDNTEDNTKEEEDA